MVGELRRSAWDVTVTVPTEIKPRRMTRSIIARDPVTGALGGAVASRFFAVGAICIHAEGRVAVLSAQALVNPMYAVHAIRRLRNGEAADTVLAAVIAPDTGAAHRQFHVVDAASRIAQHTGASCVTWAGHVRGQDVSVVGNMLSGPQIVQRTLEACEAATGNLAERLLTAMEAGEVAGDDKRGKQSAALKICTRDPYPDLDIRADDHPDPLAELRRLYRVSRERFAVFRRFLPGTESPWGAFDRAVIDAAIARESVPPA